MTKLLVQGETILAQGPFVITEDAIKLQDMVCPFHVIPEWQIVDANIPAGFTPAGYTWDGVNVVAKPLQE